MALTQLAPRLNTQQPRMTFEEWLETHLQNAPLLPDETLDHILDICDLERV